MPGSFTLWHNVHKNVVSFCVHFENVVDEVIMNLDV